MTLQGPKIDFNKVHLNTGDALPANTGKLRAYNMRFCPFAHRMILALNAKKVDFEVINIDLGDKPQWFFAKSPEGKVPSLETKDGKIITESLIIVQYLDEVYPARRLLPADPLQKAYDHIFIETFGSSIPPLFLKMVKAPDTITEEHIAAFHKGLHIVQEQLKSRGTTFLDGEEPGYADYMIWPWFERLSSVEDDFAQITGPKYELLSAYIKKMQKDPAVSQYLIPKEIYIKFHSAFTQGIKPDFNLLANKN